MKKIPFSTFLYKEAYRTISFFIICGFIISCKKETSAENKVIPFNNAMQELFVADIQLAITHLDSIALFPIKDTKDHFIQSRKYFKKLEPILSSLDVENYGFLNQPNILKIEEEDFTDIKIKSPSGYQVLEELLFQENPDSLEILKHTNLITNRLKLIQKNTAFSHLKPYHFLWMFRKAIVRVALTGVTGFDSPVLENAVEESKIVYLSLKELLALMQEKFSDKALFYRWNNEIDYTLDQFKGDFNNFDRYHFIKNHTHKQLQLWNETVKDWKVIFPFELALKNNTSSLFSKTTFNINYFSDEHQGNTSLQKIALGKKLFYDKKLSKNNEISCASCHQPEKMFTDGLKTSKGVTRNSPTLLYAALQQAFFYDKRAGGLEGQISNVVENKNEFHTDLKTIEKVIFSDSSYSKAFKKIYPNTKINNSDIRNALASYIRSLLPFNSKLDKNINGLEETLTKNEIRGFNLFHGKAKCATCHFPPLFNGTVPPDYKESEIELLGVPKENDTIDAVISDDLGRYYVYKTPQRKHFFKTPTIRNAAITGPYMHNGVYTTLEEVMDFYNRGGGAGIGIHQKYQTLPTDSLNLDVQEIKDIITFIKSLNESTTEY